MANTYTQIHIHCIFAVKFRQALISNEWKDRLHAYITAIIQERTHKMISINSMPDHIHILFGMRPHQSLSDLMRIVKGESSEWINKQKLSTRLFRWQEGYGAFCYTRDQIDTVAAYIRNQEQHHYKKTFRDEYKKMLDHFHVNYDERYLFLDPS